LKEERWRLQFRVLVAEYGEVGDGERIASVWWKNLSGIRGGVGVGWNNSLIIIHVVRWEMTKTLCFGGIHGWKVGC